MFFRRKYPDSDKVYQLDKFSARNSDDIYNTIEPLKGEDVPHPYIFVINKETKNIEVYENIVFSEEDNLILCDETRKKMESDDSVITLFDNDFRILIWPCDSFPKNSHESDMIPYVYTKVGDQYVILHKYNLSYPFASMNNTWDDVKVIPVIGGGTTANNLPLIVVRKDSRTIIFTEQRGTMSWYPGYGMLYETNEPVKSVLYTRTTGSGRWILTKHQIFINNGKDVTVLFTERGDDNFFATIEYKDSVVTPLDEHGEFILIDPKDKQKYAVRADKSGHHKTRIMNGRNGTDPISLPKNMSYMNCLRRPNSHSITYICDEDTDKIYRIQGHFTKDDCLSIVEVSPYINDDSKDKSFYKKGDTWYANFRTIIPSDRDAIYPEEEDVLLDRNIIGVIDDGGKLLSIQRLLSNIPKHIEVPVCKREGNHYTIVPTYTPNMRYNMDLIDSGEDHINQYAITIEVLSTNISKVMRQEIPWYDMKLWWHRK